MQCNCIGMATPAKHIGKTSTTPTSYTLDNTPSITKRVIISDCAALTSWDTVGIFDLQYRVRFPVAV